jgi:hypothetical protein
MPALPAAALLATKRHLAHRNLSLKIMHDAIYTTHHEPVVPGLAGKTCVPGGLPRVAPPARVCRAPVRQCCRWGVCARAQKVKSKGTHWICSVMLALGTCFVRTSLCTSCAARGHACSLFADQLPHPMHARGQTAKRRRRYCCQAGSVQHSLLGFRQARVAAGRGVQAQQAHLKVPRLVYPPAWSLCDILRNVHLHIRTQISQAQPLLGMQWYSLTHARLPTEACMHACPLNAT